MSVFDNSHVLDQEDEKILSLLENTSKQQIRIKNKVDLETKLNLDHPFDLELNSKDDVTPLIKKLEAIMDRSNSSDEIMLISQRQIAAVEETIKNIDEAFTPLEDQELEIFSFHLNDTAFKIIQ